MGAINRILGRSLGPRGSGTGHALGPEEDFHPRPQAAGIFFGEIFLTKNGVFCQFFVDFLKISWI